MPASIAAPSLRTSASEPTMSAPGAMNRATAASSSRQLGGGAGDGVVGRVSGGRFSETSSRFMGIGIRQRLSVWIAQ